MQRRSLAVREVHKQCNQNYKNPVRRYVPVSAAPSTHDRSAEDVAAVVDVDGVVADVLRRPVGDVQLDDVQHQLPLGALRLQRQPTVEPVAVEEVLEGAVVRVDDRPAEQLHVVAVLVLHVVCRRIKYSMLPAAVDILNSL